MALMDEKRLGPSEVRELLRLAALGMSIESLSAHFAITEERVIALAESRVPVPLRLMNAHPKKKGSEESAQVADARFAKRVDRGGVCHLWVGGKNASGYGLFEFNGKIWLAHRYAWHSRNGPIPDGLVIRHLCHVKSCVNPDHLATGTHQQNAEDSVRRRRGLSTDFSTSYPQVLSDKT